MNRKRRGGFSILAAVLAVMLALFLGLLFWLLHGNEEPERILQGAAGTETLSVSCLLYTSMPERQTHRPRSESN